MRSLLMRYGSALAALALATAVRRLFDPFVGEHLPFVTFSVAVVVTAWCGGLGPALIVLTLGGMAGEALFVLPHSPPGGAGRSQVFGMALYLLVGLVSILIIELLHAGRRRAETHAREALRRQEPLEQEIARRKQAEEDLQQQREWLRVVLASVGDAVLAADLDGRVRFLNPGAAALTGWGADEALGQPLAKVFRIIDEETREPAEALVDAAVRLGKYVGTGSVLVARDGSEIPIHDSVAAIADAQGKVIGVVVTFRDISLHRRAEKALAQLAAIVESSTDAIIGGDLEGGIHTWNQGAERLYGYSASEAVGRRVSALVPPDRADELPGLLERLKRGERVNHFETERVRKDGSRVPVSVTVSPIKSGFGTIVGVSAIARDITEAKRVEQALREANRRVLSILESITDGFVAFDHDWRFTYVNGAAARFLKQTRQELVGKVGWDVFQAPFEQGFRRAGHFEAFHAPLGSWFDCHCYPSEEGLSVFFRDITARKRAEKERTQLLVDEAAPLSVGR